MYWLVIAGVALFPGGLWLASPWPILGFLLFAIMVSLVVNEAGDLAGSQARCLLRWEARRIGRAEQAERYEEEWLADLERVPAGLTKFVYACGVVIWSVPHLRTQFRQGSRRARLPGVLPVQNHGRDR
jgi:hypothetical protein